MQPERQQPPPSTTVLAHSCSPCASHSTAASAHVAAELSIQVRGAKVLCDGDALPSEGSLLQREWQLWLRWQQRTTPNAAPAERCRASFDKPRREVHAGTTRRAPNIELQPRPSFQDKSRAGGSRVRRPPWQAAAVRQQRVAWRRARAARPRCTNVWRPLGEVQYQRGIRGLDNARYIRSERSATAPLDPIAHTHLLFVCGQY